MTQTHSSDLLNCTSSGRGGDSFPGDAEIADRAERLLTVQRTRYRRLWLYFRNPMRHAGASDGSSALRPYRQAQEWGLPARITGVRSGADMLAGETIDGVARKEVVIENDIGWRVETGVDYLFGKPLVIESAAADPDRRALIGELLREILASNGGILLLQQLATLGSVYGFVDVLVKLQSRDDDGPLSGASSRNATSCETQDLGRPSAFSRAASLTRRGRADHEPSDREASDPRIDRPVDRACDSDAAMSSCALAESASRANQQDVDPVDFDPDATGTRAASHPSPAPIARLARMVRLEVVEPARVLPFLSPNDWREVVAYGQAWETPVEPTSASNTAQDAKTGWLDRLRRRTSRPTSDRSLRVRFAGGASISANPRDRNTIVELITPTRWMRHENGRLVAQGENSLGRIPLVHIQNAPIPMEYAGASDVEPLIPLQDELNTRLSDRACRITLQSFKMYLGRGIENFLSLPIAPGQMWMTENDKADVIEFGGDASCPSEEAHISDIREAMKDEATK